MSEPYYRVTEERMDELKQAAIALARANKELERARAEIAALREALSVAARPLTAIAQVQDALRAARAEALEEAARVCERRSNPGHGAQWQAAVSACVDVIRALKDKSRTPGDA